MSVSESERAAIEARAGEVGMTPASYLAMRGQERISVEGSGGSGDDGWSASAKRALVAELYALKRGLRASANNMNQMTRWAHATEGEWSPAEMRATAEHLRRKADQIDAFLDAVSPILHP